MLLSRSSKAFAFYFINILEFNKSLFTFFFTSLLIECKSVAATVDIVYNIFTHWVAALLGTVPSFGVWLLFVTALTQRGIDSTRCWKVS